MTYFIPIFNWLILKTFCKIGFVRFILGTKWDLKRFSTALTHKGRSHIAIEIAKVKATSQSIWTGYLITNASSWGLLRPFVQELNKKFSCSGFRIFVWSKKKIRTVGQGKWKQQNNWNKSINTKFDGHSSD